MYSMYSTYVCTIILYPYDGASRTGLQPRSALVSFLSTYFFLISVDLVFLFGFEPSFSPAWSDEYPLLIMDLYSIYQIYQDSAFVLVNSSDLWFPSKRYSSCPYPTLWDRIAGCDPMGKCGVGNFVESVVEGPMHVAPSVLLTSSTTAFGSWSNSLLFSVKNSMSSCQHVSMSAYVGEALFHNKRGS